MNPCHLGNDLMTKTGNLGGLFTVITLMIGSSINRRARRVMRRNRNDSVTNNMARQLFAQRIPNLYDDQTFSKLRQNRTVKQLLV